MASKISAFMKMDIFKRNIIQKSDQVIKIKAHKLWLTIILSELSNLKNYKILFSILAEFAIDKFVTNFSILFIKYETLFAGNLSY